MFDTSARDHLFNGVTPNIRGMITSLEASEEWTFIISESPEVYEEISSVVNALLKRNTALLGGGDALFDRLIMALSSISFSYSIVALCYLDTKAMPNGGSVAEHVVDHAFSGCSDSSSAVINESRIMKERVSLFVESGILVNMFSGLIKEKVL